MPEEGSENFDAWTASNERLPNIPYASLPKPSVVDSNTFWIAFSLLGSIYSVMAILVVHWPITPVLMLLIGYPVWAASIFSRVIAWRGQYWLAAIWLLLVWPPIALRTFPRLAGWLPRDDFKLGIELFFFVPLTALVFALVVEARKGKYHEGLHRPQIGRLTLALLVIAFCAGPVIVLELHYMIAALGT